MAGATKAVETTDKVVISELTVEPGSSNIYSFTVRLEGSLMYTAYQMDIYLPEELTLANGENDEQVEIAADSEIYPYDEYLFNKYGIKEPLHTISYNTLGDFIRIIGKELENNTSLKDVSGDLFKVYVKASPYLKPGDVEIAIKDVYLTTSAAVQYEPADYVSTSVTAAATSTLTLKVSDANQFGTCILPFDYELPADGSLEAYTCSEYTEDALLLTKAGKIAAYTPYILYSEAGFSATISGEVDATKYPTDGIVKSGYLVGTVVQTELTEATSYVMQNQGSGVKFHQVDPASPFVLAAGKCYVELPEGANASALRIEATTGIASSELTTQNLQLIYNLLGQRVEKMQPGHIYMVNGRKVIVE